MTQKADSSGGTAVATGLALFVILYFGSPYALLRPLNWIYGPYTAWPKALSEGAFVVFTPVRLVAMRSEAYMQYLERNEKLVGFQITAP